MRSIKSNVKFYEFPIESSMEQNLRDGSLELTENESKQGQPEYMQQMEQFHNQIDINVLPPREPEARDPSMLKVSPYLQTSFFGNSLAKVRNRSFNQAALTLRNKSKSLFTQKKDQSRQSLKNISTPPMLKRQKERDEKKRLELQEKMRAFKTHDFQIEPSVTKTVDYQYIEKLSQPKRTQMEVLKPYGGNETMTKWNGSQQLSQEESLSQRRQNAFKRRLDYDRNLKAEARRQRLERTLSYETNDGPLGATRNVIAQHNTVDQQNETFNDSGFRDIQIHSDSEAEEQIVFVHDESRSVSEQPEQPEQPLQPFQAEQPEQPEEPHEHSCNLENEEENLEHIVLNRMIDTIWDQFDVDGSGDLDRDETRQFLDQLMADLTNSGEQQPISDQQFTHIFDQVDADKSNTIEKEEMVEFIHHFVKHNKDIDFEEKNRELTRFEKKKLQQQELHNQILSMIDTIWDNFDEDGSGDLDKEETRVFVDQLLQDLKGEKITDQGFEEVFEKFDEDKSGTVEKDEMVEFIKHFINLDNGSEDESFSESSGDGIEDQAIMEMIDTIWDQYDEDGSGDLDKDETRRFVEETLNNLGGEDQVLTDEEFERRFELFDKDGSGSIEKDEFVEFIRGFLGLEKKQKAKAKAKKDKKSRQVKKKQNLGQMIDRIWDEYDTDKSGDLDKEETRQFVEQMLGVMASGSDGKVSDADFENIWHQFDDDGSGLIEKEEMKEFLKHFLGDLVDDNQLDQEEEQKVQDQGRNRNQAGRNQFDTPELDRAGHVQIQDHSRGPVLEVKNTKALNQFSAKLGLSKLTIDKQVLGARQAMRSKDYVVMRTRVNERAPRHKILEFERIKQTTDEEVKTQLKSTNRLYNANRSPSVTRIAYVSLRDKKAREHQAKLKEMEEKRQKKKEPEYQSKLIFHPLDGTFDQKVRFEMDKFILNAMNVKRGFKKSKDSTSHKIIYLAPNKKNDYLISLMPVIEERFGKAAYVSVDINLENLINRSDKISEALHSDSDDNSSQKFLFKKVSKGIVLQINKETCEKKYINACLIKRKTQVEKKLTIMSIQGSKKSGLGGEFSHKSHKSPNTFNLGLKLSKNSSLLNPIRNSRARKGSNTKVNDLKVNNVDLASQKSRSESSKIQATEESRDEMEEQERARNQRFFKRQAAHQERESQFKPQENNRISEAQLLQRQLSSRKINISSKRRSKKVKSTNEQIEAEYQENLEEKFRRRQKRKAEKEKKVKRSITMGMSESRILSNDILSQAHRGYRQNDGDRNVVHKVNTMNQQALLTAFKGKFMTEEEMRYNDAIVCYDLFLIMDETNLRFLTWHQISKYYANFLYFGEGQIFSDDSCSDSFSNDYCSLSNESLDDHAQKSVSNANFKRFQRAYIRKKGAEIPQLDYKEFQELLELSKVDIMATRDKLLEKEFNGRCFKRVPLCSRCCKYVRKKMVTLEYDKVIKKEQAGYDWFSMLNLLRKAIFENVDQVTHLILLNEVYQTSMKEGNQDQNSYKLAFLIIAIAFFSTFLLQHSSIMKMMLSKGFYEPQITKNDSMFKLVYKIVFLTCFGPIILVLVEILIILMAVCQIFALLSFRGKKGYQTIQSMFGKIFTDYFGLYENEVEEIMHQKGIVQLFFEDLPVISVQICIALNILPCPDLITGDGYTLLLSTTSTLSTIVFTLILIYLQSTALEETVYNYCLYCFQAKQGWIPFLHKLRKNQMRHSIDFSNIKCNLPGLTGKTAIYATIKYNFTNVSLQKFLLELIIWESKYKDSGVNLMSHANMIDSSISSFTPSYSSQDQELKRADNTRASIQKSLYKHVFDLSNSIDHVTLNMTLHFYQLTPKFVIKINIDNVKWQTLIENTHQINMAKQDQNGKFIALTPSGQNCLWICAEDEQVKPNDFKDEDIEAYERIKNRKKLTDNLSGTNNKAINLQGAMSKKLKRLQSNMQKQQMAQNIKNMLGESLKKSNTMKRSNTTVIDIQNLRIGEWILQDCAKIMLKENFLPDIRNPNGETLINYAINQNKLEFLKLILENGASSTYKDINGMTPLGQCLVSQNIEALNIILKYDVDPEESQIFDPRVSDHTIKIQEYICSLLRIFPFLHVKYKKIINILKDKFHIQVQTKQDKQIIFKQFAMVFATGKDNYLEQDESLKYELRDFNFNQAQFDDYKFARDHLYNQKLLVAILIRLFHPSIDIIKETDPMGNNLLHFVAENYLIQTCTKFFATVVFMYTDAKENAEAFNNIKKLVNKPNDLGITPLMVAFKSIYSSKQLELIKFLVKRVDQFDQNVEQQALNHLLEIMKYQQNHQIKSDLEYLKNYISKFSEWENVHKPHLIAMVKESSSNKTIKVNLRLLNIDINVTQEYQSSLGKPMTTWINKSQKLVAAKQDNALKDLQVTGKVQKTLWEQLHKFGFGQLDSEDREIFGNNQSSNLQYLCSDQQFLINQEILVRGVTFTATGFKEGTNLDSILTIKKRAKISKHASITYNDHDNDDLFESSLDKGTQTNEEYKHNPSNLASIEKNENSIHKKKRINDLDQVVVDKDTQIWFEDIEHNMIKYLVEEQIIFKGKVEACAKVNLVDMNANFSDSNHIGAPGGQLLQLFYILDQIEIHFPDGFKNFNQKKLLRDDPHYFLEPHRPRELLLEQHFFKFLVKYLVQMQNDSIEIVINRECDNYLQEHNGTLTDLSQMNQSNLISFISMVQKQKVSLFHQRNNQNMTRLYEYMLKILALSIPHNIENMLKREYPLQSNKALQSKIKLVKIPEGQFEDNYIGEGEVNDTDELVEADLYLDRGSSKERAIIIIDLPEQEEGYEYEEGDFSKQQGEGKSILIQTRNVGEFKENYYCVNKAASIFYRQNILTFIDKAYPEFFKDSPETIQDILDEANERSDKDIEFFIEKSQLPVIVIPLKIELSGLYQQQTRVPEYDIGNKLNQFSAFAQDNILQSLSPDKCIFTRCIYLNQQQEIDYSRLRLTYEKQINALFKNGTASMVNKKEQKIKKFNKYLEFAFNLTIELIALADLSGDIAFSRDLYVNGHLGWFTASIACMISPFLVCYIPLLAFQELNGESKEQTHGHSHSHSQSNSHSQSSPFELTKENCRKRAKKAFSITALTPLVLIYLLLLDIGYIIIYMIIQIVIVIKEQINFLRTGEEDSRMKQNRFDSYYANFIDISKEDLKGFRRLRTISQFTFESIPQILLQIYILIQNLRYNIFTEINSMVIVFSLLAAILHAMIEMIFINLEAEACKTTLMHYFIVCFNARFGWVPFSDQFSTSSGYQLPEKYSQEDLDYEDMNSSLLGQNFKLEFEFTDSTCKALTNCVVNLPIMIKKDQVKKSLKLGASLNQVSVNNIFELINVSNNRINLDIDGVDLKSVLQRSRETVQRLKYPEYSVLSDSLIEQMVISGQCQVVKDMHSVGAHMDFSPSLYSLARDRNDFKMLETLTSLEYPELISELSQIENYTCSFYNIVNKEKNAKIIASIFLNSKYVVSEQFQEAVLVRIFKFLEMDSTVLSDQEGQKNVFFLLKVLCGPEIPYYLLKGEGEVDIDQKIDLYTKQTLIGQFFNLMKEQKNKFPPFIFINSDKNSKIIKLPLKSAFYFAKIRVHYVYSLNFESSYAKRRNSIIINDSDSHNSQEWPSDSDSDFSEIDDSDFQSNLFDLKQYNINPKTLLLIDRILSDNHQEIGILTKEDTAKCDHAVNVLCLDKHRDRYFARTRQGDTTKSVRKILLSRMRLDQESQEPMSGENVVIPEFIPRENLKVLNVIRYQIPEYVIAVKLFRATFSHRNGVVLLNIAKKVHQTSQVISKQQQSGWAHDRFIQKYDVDRDEFDQEEEQQLQNPRGYNDVLCSAQAGDIIMLNFIGDEIKDIEVYLELYSQFEIENKLEPVKKEGFVRSFSRRLTMGVKNLMTNQ